MNIPFKEKGINRMNKKGGLEGESQGNFEGKALRIMAHLGKERKYAQDSSPKSCFKTNQRANLAINQKRARKEKVAKTRVSQT